MCVAAEASNFIGGIACGGAGAMARGTNIDGVGAVVNGADSDVGIACGG